MFAMEIQLYRVLIVVCRAGHDNDTRPHHSTPARVTQPTQMARFYLYILSPVLQSRELEQLISTWLMLVSHVTHTTNLPSWTSCVMSNILWTDSTPWRGYQLDFKTGLLAPWEHYLSLPGHQLTSKSSPLSNPGEDGAWCPRSQVFVWLVCDQSPQLLIEKDSSMV